jgi:hypothetical protein
VTCVACASVTRFGKFRYFGCTFHSSLSHRMSFSENMRHTGTHCSQPTWNVMFVGDLTYVIFNSYIDCFRLPSCNMDHSKDADTSAQEIVLVIATRIHFGEASIVPPNLHEQIEHFEQFCYDCAFYLNNQSAIIPTIIVQGVIAVDAATKPKHPSQLSNCNDPTAIQLVPTVQESCDQVAQKFAQRATNPNYHPIQVIPVQPWGKFTPALNAIITYTARFVQQSRLSTSALPAVITTTTTSLPLSTRHGSILFCSLETVATPKAIHQLLSKMNYLTTLVCGAVLSGHDYRNSWKDDTTTTLEPPRVVIQDDDDDDGDDDIGGVPIALNGRTSPWNTLALWNVSKLALTGFLAVSEGLHDDPTMAGVEEVATISLLQKLFGAQCMKAKLMSIPSIQWDTVSFAHDPARQVWHEQKMQSKLQRAAQQVQLLAMQNSDTNHEAIVYHY